MQRYNCIFKVKTNFDTNELQTEVSLAQNRIEKLKIELIELENEIIYKKFGLDSLEEFSNDNKIGNYSLDEALSILNELKVIRQSIACGEQERKSLINVCY